MSIRPGGVRLIAALLLLAAPLVVAAWSLSGYSAQRERNSADTQLANSLNRASGTYRDLLSNADSLARTLAILAILGLAVSGAIGIFHAGVEWKLWPGPSECTGFGYVPVRHASLQMPEPKGLLASTTIVVWP